MSLYPGAPRLHQGRHVLDDTALAQSMAKAIEDAMDEVSWQVKGTHLPEMGKEDRRLMFVAISRGVLKYLHDHREAVTTTSRNQHTHPVRLDVTMGQHTAHS
jgi:hypothetical protein